VLWLALEERKEFVINAFKTLGAKREDNIRFWFGSAPDDAMKWLANECKLHKPGLVVIDTWHKLTLVENVNDYGAVNRANESLVKLSRDVGVTQLWIHHNTKSSTGDGNAVLGSSALFAAADVLLSMSQDNDGSRYMRSIQRVGEDLENTLILMDPITGSVTGGGANSRYLVNLENAKIKILSNVYDDELTKAEIAESAKINRQTAFAAVNELIREGLLVLIEGTNKYQSIRGNHRNLRNEDIYAPQLSLESKEPLVLKEPIERGLITAEECKINKHSLNKEFLKNNLTQLPSQLLSDLPVFLNENSKEDDEEIELDTSIDYIYGRARTTNQEESKPPASNYSAEDIFARAAELNL
jgi:hypothetical protein